MSSAGQNRRKGHLDPDPADLTAKSSKEDQASASEAASNSNSSGNGHVPAATKAMGTHVVLAKIAKQLPVDTILTLRKVCTYWCNPFTTELVANLLEIKLARDVPDHEDEPGRRVAWEDSKLQDFTELMRDSKQIPFGNYRMGDLALVGRQEFGQFFLVCGESVKRLNVTMNGTSPANVDRIRKIVFELAPNLEALTLDFVREGSEGPVNQPAASLRQQEELLYQIFTLPNLRILVVVQFSANRPLHSAWEALVHDLLRCAPGLHCFRSNWELIQLAIDNAPGSTSNLKDLVLFIMDTPHLQTLIQLTTRKSLKLETIYVKMDLGGNLDAETEPLFYSFMELHSQSLRELCIAVLPNRNPNLAKLRLPRMGELRTFAFLRHALSGLPALPQLQLEVDNTVVTLGDAFPKLRKLSLQSFPEDGTWLLHPNLTEFIHVGKLADIPGGLFRLGRAFPSLVKFTCSLYTAEMDILQSSLWTTPALSCVHLDSLTSGPPELDELISGVPESEFGELRQQLRIMEESAMGITLDQLGLLLYRYKTKPGVTDLRNLQKFSVRHSASSPDTAEIVVSDISGYFGFALASSSLHHIEIKKTDQNGKVIRGGGAPCFSPGCLAMIQSALGSSAFISI